MIPRAYLQEWNQTAPWPDPAQVEQDLIICRALCDLFQNEWLCDRIAFRGGTAIHKLLFKTPLRYSEDIDLIQLQPGPIGETVDAIRTALAWMGPCIGAKAFEVGEEVRAAFVAHDPLAAQYFVPGTASGKFLCDMYAIARQRLRAIGVTDVAGGEYCTFNQADLFFSHRREPITGRMAAFVWIER